MALALGATDAPLDSIAEARPTAWGRILLLALILFLAASVRLILTPLQQAAQIDLGLSDVRIANLVGMANGLPGFLVALPLGIAIDHRNRARLILLLALSWAIGAAIMPFVQGFTSLFVAQMLIALGTVSLLGVMTSMIADLCPPSKRGRAVILLGVAALAGPAFAFAGGGALFGHFREHGWALFPGMAAWRLTTMVFAIIAAALLIPVMLLREPRRHEQSERSNAILPAIRGLAARWRFILPLWIGGASVGLSEGAAGLWAAPLLTRNYGLQPDQFGAMMGIIIVLGGLAGSILGGLIADRGSAGGRRGGVLIGAIASSVLTIPAAAFPLMATSTGFGIVLGLLIVFCTMSQVATITAVTTLIPNEERGVCLALTGMAGTLVNVGFAPLAPWLAPIVFGQGNHLAGMLAVIGVVTGVIALGGFLVAIRTAPRSWQDG